LDKFKDLKTGTRQPGFKNTLRNRKTKARRQGVAGQLRHAVHYISGYHAIFHSPPASMHSAAMKFVSHNIAAFLKIKATHRRHKISTAENSKGHVNGAGCLFFWQHHP